MIKKFNDFLNEKNIHEPIDFKKGESEYQKRIVEVIDDILPDKDIKVYYKTSSGIQEIDAEIIVKPIINVKEDGYNVHFSFDIYTGHRQQLISFSLYNIKNNKSYIWKDTNIYNYYLDTKDINKIINLIKSLVNFTTNISDKSINNLINSIYDELSKKE